MQWTYSVIVKSEASKKVSEAMKDLTSSQENAAQTFKEVNNVLTNNFQENLVAALDERLREWQDSEEEGGMAQHFQQVHDNLLEVRAALVMLLDLKEGSFTNTLNALKLASNAMKETGSTMEDAMTEIYKDMYGGMEGIETRSKASARNAYDSLDVSFIDPESETFLSTKKETKYDLTDKFTGAIGSLETVLGEFPEYLTKQIITEFNSFLDRISPTSGTNVLNELLGDQKDLLKRMQLSIRTQFQAEKMLRRISEDLKDKNLTDADKDIIADTTEALGISGVYYAVSDEWKQIMEIFIDGFKKSVEEKGSDFLKDKNTIKVVVSLIEDMFKEARNAIEEKIGDPKYKVSPSISREIQSIRKQFGKEDFNIDDIISNIKNDYVSQGKDPFGLFDFEDELFEIIKKSRTEYAESNAAGQDVLLKDILNKNLEAAGLKDMISNSLNTFLVDRMDDTTDALFFEIENKFSASNNDLQKILMTEKLGASFDGIVDLVNSFNELPSNTQTGKIDPEVNKNVTIDLESMLIDNFKEAKDNRWDLLQDLGHGIDNIYYKLLDVAGDIGGSLSMLLTALTNIEMPKNMAASSSNISYD